MNGSNERDQSVERLLRQSLKAPSRAGATDACLDAEMVAAWMDGGLSDAALEAAQVHVVSCARCQALVGAMARTVNAGEAVSGAEAPRSTARPWSLMWMAPLAAAAAVALYVAMPHGPRAPSTPSVAQSRVRQEGQHAEARIDDKPVRDDLQVPAASAKARPERSAGEGAAVPSTAGARQAASDDRADIDAANARRTESSSARREDAERREANTVSTGTPGATPPPAAALADRALSAAPTSASSAAAPASAAADARTSATAATPTPAATAPATTGTLPLRRPADTVAKIAAARADIVSPNPQVRWRITVSGIERSVDGGARWNAVPLGLSAPLTAGSAPSPSVCWVVGGAGVVLRSVDGRTWQRIAFPEITDLSSVRAADALTASVSTVDGRTFSTTDGGTTWSH